MKRTYRNAIFAGLLLILAGCTSSPNARPDVLPRGEVRYRMVVQLGGDAVLRELARSAVDARFEAALQLTQEQIATSPGGWVPRFTHALLQDTSVSLALYFSKPDNELSPTSDNEQVKQWLEREVDRALEIGYKILRGRLDILDPRPHLTYQERKGRITIETREPAHADRIRSLVQNQGKIGFWPTSSSAEFQPLLQQINDLSLEGYKLDSSLLPEEGLFELDEEREMQKFRLLNPFLGKFNLQIPLLSDAPQVSYALPSDTAAINVYLRRAEARGLLPNHRLAWSFQAEIPDPEELMPPHLELIAIRDEGSDTPELDGRTITKAFADFDPTGQPMIVFVLDRRGTETWARLTRNEVGNSIAIVLDDHVLTAPKVYSEITGGRSQITGQFEWEEARDLAQILDKGALPLPVRIISSETL